MQTIILAFFLAQTAVADPLFDAIQSINEANRAAKKAGTPPCDACEVTLVGLEDPPWKQCLAELCPNGAGLYQSQMKTAGQLELTDPKEKEILDLAKVAFRKELQNSLTLNEIASEALKAGKPINSPRARIFAHAMGLVSDISLLVKKPDGSVDLGASKQKAYDYALSIGKTPISDARLQTVASVYNKYLESDNKVALLNEPYDFYVQHHSAEEIQSQVNEALDSLISSSNESAAAYGAPPHTLYRTLAPDLIERYRSGNYSREDLEALQADTTNSLAIEGIVKDKLLLAKLMQEPVVPAEYLDKNTQDLLPTFISSIKKYQNNDGRPLLNVPGFEKDVTDACTNTLALAKLTLPTEAQIKAFPASLENYKSEFRSAMSKRMSAHSMGTLNTAMTNFKFAIPPTYEEFKAGLKRKIEAEILGDQADSELYETMKTSNPGMLSVMAMYVSNQSLKDLNWGDGVKKICENAKVNPIRDAAYSARDNLLVGSDTVTTSWMAGTVTKHELGHKLSDLFSEGKMSEISKGWYDSVRTCLQKPYPFDSYVEEDWADLMSAIAGGSGVACSFTEDSADAVTLAPPIRITHSAALYRSLHQYMYRHGKIPDVCTQVLAAKGETFTLTNCDLPGAPAGN